jgi:hypothetical protein
LKLFQVFLRVLYRNHQVHRDFLITLYKQCDLKLQKGEDKWSVHSIGTELLKYRRGQCDNVDV